MKISITKNLQEGNYYIKISVIEIDPEEQESIKKFGTEWVSIEPQKAYYSGRFLNRLPLHDLNYLFSFNKEEAANAFEKEMLDRIKTAVKILKSKKDNFSDNKEYDF